MKQLIYSVIGIAALCLLWGALSIFERPNPFVQRAYTAPLKCDAGPSRPPNSASVNLDNSVRRWGVYCEEKPKWTKQNVTTPSLDGKALHCALNGGRRPYSKIYCYRLFKPEPAARVFTLTLSFWYSPTTTFNNQSSPSVVQALEFAMSKYDSNKIRYEWGLQWENVRSEPGDPVWRIWNGRKKMWISTGITDTLTAQTWHTLVLMGEIRKGRVHYLSFAIDDVCHPLDITVRPELLPSDAKEQLVAAFQLDGNAEMSPYVVVVDQVNFTRSANAPVALPYCP